MNSFTDCDLRIHEIDMMNMELTGDDTFLSLRAESCDDRKGKTTSLRVILDPHGTDCDILIEATAEGMSVLCHPGDGGDPVCRVILGENKAIIEIDEFAGERLEIRKP